MVIDSRSPRLGFLTIAFHTFLHWWHIVLTANEVL